MAPMKNSKKVKRVVVATTASTQAKAKKRSRSSDDDSWLMLMIDANETLEAKRRKQDMGADDSSTSTQHQQTKRGVKRPLANEDDIPPRPIKSKLRKTTPTQLVDVVNKNKKAVLSSLDDNDAILPSVADTPVPDVSNKNIEKKETLVNLNGAFKSRDTFKALRKQMQQRHEYMRQCRAVTISSRDYWTPNTEYTRFDGRKFTIRRPSDWLPGTEYKTLLAGKSAADAKIPVSGLKLWHQTMELHREKKLTSDEDSNKIDAHQHHTGSNFNNPMMKFRFGELPVGRNA